MNSQSAASAIPDAILRRAVARLAESGRVLRDDAKWKRGGKPEEKLAWPDVQQVGKRRRRLVRAGRAVCAVTD